MLRSHALLTAINLMVALSGAAYSQESIIDKLVTPIPSGEYSLPSLLMKVAVATGVPIGVEIAGGGQAKPKIYNGSQSITLGKVLDEIVRSEDQYEWKQSGNVIDIVLKREPTDVFDVLIDSFDAKDVLPIQMLQELLKLPTVTSYLLQKSVTPATWIAGSVSPNRASVSLRHISLRSALNEIILAGGRPGWTAFYQSHDRKEYLWFQMW